MRETLLTSSALILALILLRRLFRGKISPRLQYALWGLAALRLLLPCSLPASPMSLLNAAPEVPAAVVERRILEIPRTLPVVPTAAPEAVPEAAAPAEAEAATAPAPFSWETALRRVWLGGMVTVGAAFLLSNLRLARSLRKRRQPVKADCPIPVYAVSGLYSPCLFGRAIYLPAGAEEDEAALRHILAHELTHLRRLDPVWSLVRSFCLAVYWFDPLVWAAAVLSRRDCEAACDAATVQALGEAERFAYG
ncbi:MAG: M56 family metallopeptidase, partial [bacterium]